MASITLTPVSNMIQTSTKITGNEKLVTIGPNGNPSTVSVNSILNKIDDSIADIVEDQVMDQIMGSVDEKFDDLLDDKIDEALDLSNYFTKEQVNTVIETSVGNLDTLTTTNKENVVAAINEVKESIKKDSNDTSALLYSNPNLDFDASGNNVDSYGYVGTLQNINVNGDLILIDSIAVYVREGNPSPNLDVPVWCRLLKFVDGNWEIIYQSTESKTIQDIAPETLFSFKMKAVDDSNKLIKSSDRIAIVYVDAEDAPVISSVQLGFKTILGIGGGIQNQFVNESTGVSNWAPAFVIGYLSMADSPTNFVTLENSQTITGTKQFNNGINISGKTFITSAIDDGELKVLHNNSTKGFIVRTVNGSDSILPLQILSTNGSDSYTYTFPTKSGEVVMKEDINNAVSPLQLDIANIKNKDSEQDAEITNIKETLGHTNANLNALEGIVAEKADASKVNQIEIEVQKNTNAISNNTARLVVLEGNGEGSIKNAVAKGIAEVVANAPEDLNTLKEVADYIASDKTKANEIEKAINDLGVKDTQLENSINANATAILSKQPLLTGNEFRTINGQSIMGEGDIEIEAGITEEEKAEIDAKIEGKADIADVEGLAQEIDGKAPKVGYAPDLKVNFAKELVGRGEATPEVIGGIRPTGVRSIGDGNATITKIKGKSVVWNQFAPAMSPSTVVPMNTKVAQYTYDQDKVTITTIQEVRNDYSAAVKIPSLPHIAQHKYLIQFCAEAQNVNVYIKAITKKNVNGKQSIAAIYKASTDDNAYEPYIAISSGAAIGSTLEISNISWYDLTLMFGAGNEPTTIEEFEARKPLGVGNEYNEGTIVSYNADALKSVGFNAYNGTYAKVIGSETYHATGTTSISFAKELDGDKTPITLDSDNKFIPKEDGYVYAEGTNIVIHLTHSYTPNHVDEYEEDVHPLPNVKSILDAEGNQLFPYGLLSAGSVCDEVAATKAVKRIYHRTFNGTEQWSIQTTNAMGVVNYQINWGNTMKTDRSICNRLKLQKTLIAETQDEGYFYNSKEFFIRLFETTASTIEEFKTWLSNHPVEINVELDTPIEVDLPEPLNMTYEALDFGTEELVAKGATTPLNADIVYQFNAVDRIRENSSAIDGLEEHVEEHKDDGIELLTNGNLKLTLKGETREFMPATPSGDPMHYAYVNAGAEYNATNDFDIKDAPWKDMVDTIEDKAKWELDKVDASKVKQMTIQGVVYNYATENRTSPEGGTYLRYFMVGKGSNGFWVEDETKVLHLPKCWYLNGLGDITNAEMRSIYAVKYMSHAPGGGFAGTPCRTFIDRIKHTGSDLSYGERYHRCKIVESIYSKVNRVVNGGFNYAITSTTALRYFLPAVTLVSHTNKIYGTFGDASLRVLYIANVQTAIQFPSKYISKASILYTIDNIAPTLTSAITITLHHEAYERLKGDADILQALTTKNADLATKGNGKVSLVCATDNDTIPSE